MWGVVCGVIVVLFVVSLVVYFFLFVDIVWFFCGVVIFDWLFLFVFVVGLCLLVCMIFECFGVVSFVVCGKEVIIVGVGDVV